MTFLVIGLSAGIVAQILNFPMTYADYRRSASDRHKLREFYKDAATDFLLAELFFAAASLLLGFGMRKIFGAV